MQNLPQLSYQTEQIEISTTMFESLVRNLGENIRRMNIKIQFSNKDQKQSFTLSEQRYKEREEAISLQSEEENEGEAEPSQVSKEVVKENRRGREIREIEVKFQISILLQNKYYRDKLQKIGRRLGVKFMVVPSKVKIIGFVTENLDEAFVEFGAIQDRIRFVPITEYGQEVYQSRFYTNLLKEKKLQLLKMLNKYYIWFEEGIEDPNPVIDDIFAKTKHKLIPLKKLTSNNQQNRLECQPIKIVHGQFKNLQIRRSVFQELTSLMKATIFEKYICEELNRLQKHDDKKVELSQDRKYLILHLDAEEQLFIQEENIREMFKPFKLTFFSFCPQVDVEALTSFVLDYRGGERGFSKKKKNKEGGIPCFVQLMENVVLVAVYQKELQGFDMSKTEHSMSLNFQQHQLFKFLRQLPQQFLHFKLAVQSVLQDAQQQSQFKKFTFEKDYIEKITYIGCKNHRLKNYQMMLQCYLQKKFDAQYRQKLEELNNGKLEVSVSVDIDVSRQIDESSIMMNGSLNQSLAIAQPVAADISGQSILPHGLHVQLPVFRFQNYGFYLAEKPQEREIKFTDKVDKPKRTDKQLRNGDYENAIRDAATCKYKMYRIQVPLKFKDINLLESIQKILAIEPELEKYNRWVTVFYGGKQGKDHQNLYGEAKVKVLRVIGDNLHIMKEGYLLQTNLIFMYREFMEHSKVELPLGTYEGLCFVRKTEA